MEEEERQVGSWTAIVEILDDGAKQGKCSHYQIHQYHHDHQSVLSGWKNISSGYARAYTYLEFLPSTSNENFPYPNPPSLGCPRSFTPHPLTTSIQLLTSCSSRLTTKSKKLRPRTCVVRRMLSLAQYWIVQLWVKRSRMRAVRTDCSGRGSNRMGEALGGGVGDMPGSMSSGGTGQGGIGFGSPHRYIAGESSR